jgi:hypothetical protein
MKMDLDNVDEYNRYMNIAAATMMMAATTRCEDEVSK